MQGKWFSAIVVFGIAGGFAGVAAGVAEVRAAELAAADLREMEQLLAQLNFDPGVVDGKVDDRTRTAIRLYQEFAVLPVDGEPSANLLRELRQVSQAYTEMHEAAPVAAQTGPDAGPETGPDAGPDAGAAEAEADSASPTNPDPEIAETVKPGAANSADAAVAVVAPEAAAPAPEPQLAAEPNDAEAEAAKPGSEPEVAETEEIPREPAPEIAAAAPAEPAPAPDVAEPVAPVSAPSAGSEIRTGESGPESAPVPAPEAIESENPAPEAQPESNAATAAVPVPERDAAAAEAADPPVRPKAEAGFNLTGMIARLKQRSDGVAPAVPAPVAGTDRAGYERTLIWNVQQELQRIGISPGPADGNLRARTTAAIETYQRARGLPADGLVTEQLLARLRVEAPPPGPAAPRPQGDTAIPEGDAVPLGSVAPQTAGIDVAPRNGYQAFRAGYGAAQAGDYGSAVKLYDQAIDGGDLALEHLAAALYNRANAYQYLGILDKAIEDYSAAIINKPGFPAAYYNRGFALDLTGEKARAVEDFRTARDLGLQRLGIRSPDLPPPLL